MSTTKKHKMSNAQRITLIARSAWQRLTAAGATDEPFDAWRQWQAVDVVGVRISAATKSQLDRLETHFLAMGGQAAEAYDNATGPSNELRQLCHLIAVKQRECGLKDAYTQAVCRRMFGIDQPLTAHQAKSLLIALKNHARATRGGKEAA